MHYIFGKFRKIAPLLALAATMATAEVLSPQSGVWVQPSHAAAGVRVPHSVCFWDDLDWVEMTRVEQAVWRELGWNQVTWDSSDETAAPASEYKDWNELDPRELAAAQAFGYTAHTWDNETCDRPEPGGGE